MPCSDLFIYFTLTLGAKMGNIIGVRSTIAVALTFKYISYALLLLIPNYYVVLFAMCLFGVGSGLGNLTYLKNSWKYFPNNQGLVNGIILGGAGISSSILTPLADYLIINPDKEKANSHTGLYSKIVGNRVPTYLVILCITFLVLGIFALFITIPFEEKKRDTENEVVGETAEEEQTLIKARPGELEASLKDTFFSLKNCQLLSFCFCGFCK
jgi:MFS family permease